MMTSLALAEWVGPRSQRIDRLVDAHRKTTGGSRGRQWLTEELNHALIVRLMSEFQGCCRDLHDESIDALTASPKISDPAVSTVLRQLLTTGRKLDQGNAGPGTLGSDFGRLGIALWPAVTARYPVNGAKWNASLDRLNKARNHIVHEERQDILNWPRTHEPLTLAGVRTWRGTLNALARAFDQVVGSYLKQVNGIAPW
jgi:hypothetical protein